jgi:nicotinate-nucleotide adenylyltransferase
LSPPPTRPTVLTGVLGGTFDPVHRAHLAIARAALGKLGCARVLWMPTGATHYREAAVASGAHRVAMLRLALEGEPRYAIDARELAPGHSGYTVDTLRALRAQLQPEAALVLLLGADQYARIETWHRWQELFALARIAVFARPGWQAADARAETVAIEPSEVSSSEIRARLARGEDVSALVPARVHAYIREHRLYR